MSTECRIAFAYTVNPNDIRAYRHDIIQICPWFMEYALYQKTKSMADLHHLRSRLAVLGGAKLVKMALYKDIDLLNLPDKVLLHEMLHTKSGGKKDDVDGPLNAYGR
jgi:hypothetical protein